MKQNDTKTITIKINGKDHAFAEKKDKTKKLEKHEKKLENAWQQSMSEIASAQEAESDEEFDWILPEDDLDEKMTGAPIQPSPEKKQKGFKLLAGKGSRKSMKKFYPGIFFSIFFAVLLGTSFGFILLKMVIAEPETNTVTQPVGGTPQVEETGSVKTAAVTVEPLNVFIVQGGVFSSKENADTEMQKAKEKGVAAAIISVNEQFILLLGAADSVEAAKLVGSEVAKKGLGVFAKEITIEGSTVDGLTAEEEKLVNSAPAIYESLASGAAAVGSGQAIPAQAGEEVAKQQGIFNDISAENMENSSVQSIHKELQQALDAFAAYQEKPDAASAINIQSHLLAFLAAYQSLS